MQVNQNVNALNFMQAGSQLNAANKTSKQAKEEQDFASYLKPADYKSKQELSGFNGEDKSKIQKKPDIETTEVEKTDITRSNDAKPDKTSTKQTKDVNKTQNDEHQNSTEDSALSTDIVPDDGPVEVLVKKDESEFTEEDTELLLETIGHLLQTVVDQFGITKEELADKLESFGMKLEELFTPAGVKLFFLNMKNAEPCDLLVNEELNLQLNDFVSEMNREMELTDLPMQTVEEFIKNHGQNEILMYDKDKIFVLDDEKAVSGNEKAVNGIFDNNENVVIKETVTNEPEVIVSDHRKMTSQDEQIKFKDTQTDSQDVQVSNQDLQVSDKDVQIANKNERESNKNVHESNEDVQMPNQDKSMSNLNNNMLNQDGQMPNQDKHASGQIVNGDKQQEDMLKQSWKDFSSNEDTVPKDNASQGIPKSNTVNNKNFFDNSILQSINEAFNKIAEIPAAEETQISSRQIIEQIVEQVKVEMNQNTSSLELQLYPEHLGKIQIQVVSKDGVMTARIAAETETARQAIENGISNLKDAMEQQDLKVDAIEVMVSTTGFGKNDEEQNMEQQQKSSKPGRHLNLSDIEDEDNMEETAEMEKMRAVGSSVSYTA